jgi:ATP-dependent DNA helicase RecQ
MSLTLCFSLLYFSDKAISCFAQRRQLQTEESNNPLNDSIKAKDLFFDEVAAFNKLDESLKQIFYLLLNDKKEFHSFFHFIAYTSSDTNLEKLIREKFYSEICEQADLTKIISEHPIELAYCLALINCQTAIQLHRLGC